MTYALTWLADTLRNAGLTVIEQPGWKDRGRAEMGTVKGVLCHHTGPGEVAGLLNLLINGRSDLPGPLSQLFLERSGVYHVLAAGRCNHAGAGSWQGVTTGNSSLIGIEAQNAGDGKNPWPQVQMDAYAKGVAAILKQIGMPAIMCAGHKEYCLPRGRKIDPSFNMDSFRTSVSAIMHPDTSLPQDLSRPAMTQNPVPAMLKRGDHGVDVMMLQTLLKAKLAAPAIAIDADFGPATENAVKAFQTAHRLTADGLVGPKTWAALGV